MGSVDDAERFQPTDLVDWGAWLAEHHGPHDGVWLVTYKKGTGLQQFDYEQAVTEALRFGWIDSTQRRVDDLRSMLWFAPRRAGSGWSRSNKQRIARLDAETRLEPAGRAAVEAAKADGSWTLLDEVEDLVVPEDLAAALDRHPGARERWKALPPSTRRGLLSSIAQARRPATRQRRVREAAEKAAGAARGEVTTLRSPRPGSSATTGGSPS